MLSTEHAKIRDVLRTAVEKARRNHEGAPADYIAGAEFDACATGRLAFEVKLECLQCVPLATLDHSKDLP